jgi:hypothetical protein
MTGSSDRGYAMAALLVGMSIMGIMLGVALPAWRSMVQREREAELIFRGEQYAQAIALFNRRTGGFPTSLTALRDGRYIRQLYKDPITGGDFQPLYFGQSGPMGRPAAAGRGAPGSSGAGSASVAGRAQPQAQSGVGGMPATGRGQVQAQPTGRTGQAGFAGVQGGSPFSGTQSGRGGESAGPIVGVVSRSTGDAMRLYNGRGKYNEWLFVSTAATQQPGAPVGGPMPGMPAVGPGRGGQQPGPPGVGGAQPLPGRGARGRGEAPGATPFDRPMPRGRGPGGFEPSPFGPPGRPGGPGSAPSPFAPGRGRL